MSKIKPLSYEFLCAPTSSKLIPYSSSDKIPKNGVGLSPQKRALEALELALHINSHGYNIYLAGENTLGRRFLLKEYLVPKAKLLNTPPDLVYVHNFSDHDSPILLELPAGMGYKLKKQLGEVFPKILKEISLRTDRDTYTQRRNSIFDAYQKQREVLFSKINKTADSQGFTLDIDDSGNLTLHPIMDGKKLNEKEFVNLDSELRSTLKSKGDKLLAPITKFLRKLAKVEQDYIKKEQSMEKELISNILDQLLTPIADKFVPLCSSDKLKVFFNDLREETLEHVESLLPSDSNLQIPPQKAQGSSPLHDNSADALSHHYDVNVFVDNSKTQGAPIIFHDHPTFANLMGCIQREAEMGTLITNFTLIKAGALHKANGGFLVLNIDDLLHHHTAWEALLRSLRSNKANIEDDTEEDATKTKGLQPESLNLNVKIILVGSSDVYEYLLDQDHRFAKLFKIKAHLTYFSDRSPEGILFYLSQIKKIIDNEKLLSFNKNALSGIINFSSRLIENQNKLSLEFPAIREVLIETSTFAKLDKSKTVDIKHLKQALDARELRSNLVEEIFLEEYDQKIIKVATSGYKVGTVNGLSVAAYGDFEFGLPHQISCTIGAGNSGIIDLEREAELSGPIHTKAMMILKSYLLGAFAHNKPITLSGSLGFEQNYTGIEGDSASGAELAALLSAIANVPINLSLAFTGAVSQSGQILAVGGVTRKIEGYFAVCKRHGLTGEQGVIMPKDNITHLMLNDEVVNSVKNKQFHIHAIEHISEALELLTGYKTGKLLKDGSYTKDSLFSIVDKRIYELGEISKKFSNNKVAN